MMRYVDGVRWRPLTVTGHCAHCVTGVDEARSGAGDTLEAGVGL